ncbi:MAG: hypothetical protein AVDCRST_MAG18-5008 [uncultured Thermomicrobiales bacterium]|uniref:Uncharacterized protein n=1 Tax=uncultured Thermomicrobiales bacterium TaxID=1645740 RepID=A0A6J4VVA5_9BACT|nr:MAG: hypothetical protein AVDCRST_MAG18-5008 [uncultured Thermomicrobiales bacterium]
MSAPLGMMTDNSYPLLVVGIISAYTLYERVRDYRRGRLRCLVQPERGSA